MSDYEDVLAAFREEVREALPSSQEIVQAIRLGVADAMWRMITNGTTMPCNDFFDSIKEGVEKAMRDVLT